MSSSANEDQEQRKNTSMEDPQAMTIEFLRARLLSERSVSKTARQRADELAKRVEELEGQLQFVTLQRKKAEMATVDVLAILGDHGISDASEGFDSSSDHEEALHESNSHNHMERGNEVSTNIQVRRNDKEAYSSSEIDSYPSTGRSLSWKSGKDLQYSLQRKKHMDVARRRSSFVSDGSSMRRAGKSCRSIRHRETRSAIEKLQNHVHVKATYSSDVEPDTSRKSPEDDKVKNQLKNSPVVSENHRQETNGHYFGGHGGDNDMERALKHQAQLIWQYEEEEKAQREWEERFRENNIYTPDSYDPGNHSDVTEEQDGIKAPEPPYKAGATSSDNHHSNVTEEQGEIKASEQPYTAGATSSGNHHSDVTEDFSKQKKIIFFFKILRITTTPPQNTKKKKKKKKSVSRVFNFFKFYTENAQNNKKVVLCFLHKFFSFSKTFSKIRFRKREREHVFTVLKNRKQKTTRKRGLVFPFISIVLYEMVNIHNFVSGQRNFQCSKFKLFESFKEEVYALTHRNLDPVDVILIVISILKHYCIRKNTSMEDPQAMTIEFLRARLLSERSVSKTARQRADELAKRVEELEGQLQFVTLQRKKAEMATVDVLAILGDHGISDASEGFDSSSDHEEALHESNSHNHMERGNEVSTNIQVRRNDKEAYSSSEIDSYPSTGRSLSWKSGKDLQYSLQRKKHMDVARRRSSFVSDGSSMRRAGKSCRSIRHRETRSAIEKLQNHVHVKATYMSENHRQETNGHYFGGHGGDNDMERALKHQAQLIWQYEEEEKAQREWEERFRENNIYTPDSYDPGNHSDVTEEQDGIKAPEPPYKAGATSSDNHHSNVTEEQGEIKASEQPYTAGATSSGNHHSDVTEEQDGVKALELHCIAGAKSSGNHHSDVTEERDEIKAPELPYTAGASLAKPEMKTEPMEAYFDEEPQTSKSLPSILDSNNGNLSDQRCSGTIAFESSVPKFSCPMSIGSSDQQFSGKHLDAPLHSSLQCLPSCTSSYPSAKITLIRTGDSVPMYVSSGSPSSRDLAVMRKETFTDLDSVLENLQQAKLSLKQNLNSLPLVPGGASGNVIKSSNPETSNVDKFKIPVAYPRLFRLPTDNEFETINRGNRPSIGTQLGFTKISSEGAGEMFFSNPSVESRSALVGDRFLSVYPSPFTEIRPGVSMQGPLSQPRLAAGPPSSDGLNYSNPHMDSNDFYPFLPDFTLRLPLQGGISRTFPSSELGVPPVTRFS
ncbi:Hypothetical predicted protein [Olea europaea subsp. europaea]|uniref:Uncharacterized protein n=1 Tax=Olea europaea subsp. europaea TaxID=158383 RepID=A0A8S0VK93_OLEEU|nr:Hypothetical predicted protein [Olea europaea subsp. europaea]